MLPTVFGLRPSASAVSLPSNGWPWSMRFLQCARMRSRFEGFRRFRRQALREESGLAQRPHFRDVESRFARLVVNAFQLGELVGCVFVFQRVTFLSLSINRLFLQMKASTSIPCCVRVGLLSPKRAFTSLVTVGRLVTRKPDRACRFFISPPSFGIRAQKPTVRPRRVGI